jgi:hypothetical protein
MSEMATNRPPPISSFVPYRHVFFRRLRRAAGMERADFAVNGKVQRCLSTGECTPTFPLTEKSNNGQRGIVDPPKISTVDFSVNGKVG